MAKIGLACNEKQIMRAELEARGIAVTDDALEEFDTSLTIEALTRAFVSLGHKVEVLGWGRMLLRGLSMTEVDLVFNIAEGVGGRSREAQVPAVLEMMGVPWVGSDATALGVSLDKDLTKRLVQAAGVRVPRGFLATKPEEARAECAKRCIQFPVIVKPNGHPVSA